MRILIASSTYAPAMNGQAVFTTNLAEGMVRLGHEVMLILDSHQVRGSEKSLNGVLVEELRSISLERFRPGVFFSPNPVKVIRHLFDVFQPDVVHIQDHYPSCKAVVRVALERRIKLVGTNHFIPANYAPYTPGYSMLKPFYHWLFWQWMLATYRHVDIITAQSLAAARQLQARRINVPMVTISCGIDLKRFSPQPEINKRVIRQRFGIDPNKKVFLFLGRIDGEKHLDLLLRAMQQLPRDDVQMVIAGRGSKEAVLKQEVMRSKLEERVHFTGLVSEEGVTDLLNCVDVFVMPSEAELLSLSSLEAMACGKPVLLADALALPELVRVGENGYLFKPGDVSDLCHQISRMADHPERWQEMGRVSRELVMVHSLEETLEKYQNLYLELLSQVPITDRKTQAKQPV